MNFRHVRRDLDFLSFLRKRLGRCVDDVAERVGDLELEVQSLAKRPVEYGVNINPALTRMRPDSKALEPIGVPAFQADGLPDAGKRSVPALLPKRKFGERR